MIGELTFDKSSQNVSLLLYSVFLIHRFGENDRIRRNYDPNSFVERMAAFMGTKAYNKDGREERTIFNKSLYAQYYGFITRFKDSENKEWLSLTVRGKKLLRYISEKNDEPSCNLRFYIKEENRHFVQDLLWTSILFDPHGKHNAGAQTSNTDVDPLGMIIRCVFDLGYASNDEIFYALFGLNKGDSGNERINKGYADLKRDIITKRNNDDYDYSSYFTDWGVVNKVSDAKVVNILTDPNFDILTKKENEFGIEYNYLSDSCSRFLKQSNLVHEVSMPQQLILYSHKKKTITQWINESLLGRYCTPPRYCIKIKSSDDSVSAENLIMLAHNSAFSNPQQDCFIIIDAQDETLLEEISGIFLPLFERVTDFTSPLFGSSSSSINISNNTNTIFPSNLHIIATITMSDNLSTNPVFDGQFKRLNIEDSTNVSLSDSIAQYTDYVKLLKKNYNVVLTGAPGTGKTFISKQIAAAMVADSTWSDLSKEQKEHVEFVQFHPSFDYTDFVEGLRPEGDNEFKLKDGVFKAFCKKAAESEDDTPFVFIIDEINRGEISKIFGELFYSIEPDYRGDETRVKTQYNNLISETDIFKDGFYVPENVYIIGTMNDIDRGVEAMDFAIRRRFAWREVTTEESADNMGLSDIAKKVMSALNKALNDAGLSNAYCIGGAYFRKLEGDDFATLWNYHLKGIVSEYFRGEPDADKKLKEVAKAYNAAYRLQDEQNGDITSEAPNTEN